MLIYSVNTRDGYMHTRTYVGLPMHAYCGKDTLHNRSESQKLKSSSDGSRVAALVACHAWLHHPSHLVQRVYKMKWFKTLCLVWMPTDCLARRSLWMRTASLGSQCWQLMKSMIEKQGWAPCQRFASYNCTCNILQCVANISENCVALQFIIISIVYRFQRVRAWTF